MADAKKEAEESLREAIKVTVEIAQRLQGCCQSTQDLIDVLQLALTSDGQFRMVSEKMVDKGRK